MTATTIAAGPPVSAAKPWYKILYVQGLIAIVIAMASYAILPGAATGTG